MNTQQLKERYAPPEIPKCRVCGAELTVQRVGGGPTIWGCTGMTDDPTGERNWIYAEGRSCADEHYERSRWSDYRQGGDAEVIELIERLEAAEAELAQLKAAATGEPVHFYREHNPSNGMKTDWVEVDSEQLAILKESTSTDTAEFRTLYSAAQPAVVPPEIDSLNELAGDKHSFAMGYNRAIRDALALGAQQQQPVVELPETSYGVIQSGKVVMIPAPDGHWLNKTSVCESLDAAGVKWEV